MLAISLLTLGKNCTVCVAISIAPFAEENIGTLSQSSRLSCHLFLFQSFRKKHAVSLHSPICQTGY